MYLVGKDADGSDAVGRDTADAAGNGAGANGNGHANGDGLNLAPDLDEIRADAARRAATELATAALNASDVDTAAHSDDVDVLADGLCRQFGLSGRERENIIAAARLHDIGKVAIPPHVLEKPGPLSDAEWAIMRRHTVVGQQILDAVPEMEEVAKLVRHSHERWDGEGYPDGLADEEIPLGSRIVACADAFHAVRSDRAYRRGRDAEAVLDEIVSCSGSQFDPDVVDALELLVRETRAQAAPGRAGPRTTYRSTRLAALLLALALGVGASAVARFAGSPLAPQAEAAGEPSMPLPAVASPFDLPDLSDLPIFDFAAIGTGDDTDRAARPGAREDDTALASGQGRGRSQGNPRPGEGSVAPAPVSPGVGQGSGGPGASGNPGDAGSDGPGRGNTGTPPTPPAGGGGGPVSEPATEPQGPPVTPPGQIPGGNPGHGGLPPGNPLAPGHQSAGTPGHGAIPQGQGGAAPGQIQKETRAELAGS